MAGYNEHLTTNPGISIPRITGAYNCLCQNVNSLGICHIEIVKVNDKPHRVLHNDIMIIHIRLAYPLLFLQRKFLFPILGFVSIHRYHLSTVLELQFCELMLWKWLNSLRHADV